MVRQVDDRGAIRGGAIVDAELPSGTQRVGYFGVEGARIALLTVGAPIPEAHAHRSPRREGMAAPDAPPEAPLTPVQVVWVLVGRNADVATGEPKACPRDAVGVTADGGAEIGLIAQVGVQRIEAQDYLSRAAGPVRNRE